MRIGVLADATGVTVRALRYYEQRGLLVPSRTATGHRQFGPSDIDRVILIQELFAAGLHSRRMGELLPKIASGAGLSHPAVLPALDEERARLVAQVRDTQRALEVLDDLRARAGAMTDACDSCPAQLAS